MTYASRERGREGEKKRERERGREEVGEQGKGGRRVLWGFRGIA